MQTGSTSVQSLRVAGLQAVGLLKRNDLRWHKCDIGGGASRSRPRRFTPRSRGKRGSGAATRWANSYGFARALQHGSDLVRGSCSRLSSEELSSASARGQRLGLRGHGVPRERARPGRRRRQLQSSEFRVYSSLHTANHQDSPTSHSWGAAVESRRRQLRGVRGGARRDPRGPAKHAGPRDAWRGPSPATPQGPLPKLELGPRPPEPYELREAWMPEPVPPQPHDLPLPATPRDEPEPGPPENHGPHIHVGHAQPVSSALPPWKSD